MKILSSHMTWICEKYCKRFLTEIARELTRTEQNSLRQKIWDGISQRTYACIQEFADVCQRAQWVRVCLAVNELTNPLLVLDKPRKQTTLYHEAVPRLYIYVVGEFKPSKINSMGWS